MKKLSSNLQARKEREEAEAHNQMTYASDVRERDTGPTNVRIVHSRDVIMVTGMTDIIAVEVILGTEEGAIHLFLHVLEAGIGDVVTAPDHATTSADVEEIPIHLNRFLTSLISLIFVTQIVEVRVSSVMILERKIPGVTVEERDILRVEGNEDILMMIHDDDDDK